MSNNIVQKATGASPSGLADSLIFDNGSNVGIGNTSPSAFLDVSGAIVGQSTITALTTFQSISGNDLRLNANGSNRDVFLQVNGTTLMTVQGSTSSVGIGTTSPDGLLTITAASQGQLLLHLDSGADGGIARFDGGDGLSLEVLGSDSGIVLGDYVTDRQTDPRIDFYSGGSETLGNYDNRLVSVGENYSGIGNGLMRFQSRIVEIQRVNPEEDRSSFRLRVSTNGNPADDYSAIMSLNKPSNCIEFEVDDTLLTPGDNVRVTIGASAEARLDIGAGAFLLSEMSAPSGISNRCVIFAEDNGSGKTRLMAKFGSGSAQQIAIEP